MKELLIFAKTPKVGATKTRLIPSLGAQGACDAHRRLVEDTLARFDHYRGATLKLCVTQINDETRAWSKAHSSLLELQQGTDLGARMHWAMNNALARAEKAVLIGCDCPLLDAGYLDQAFAALQRTDLVIGPAFDGGYVLIGANAKVPAAIFDDIPWGTGVVLTATRQAIKDIGLAAMELDPLWDVDTDEDWRRYLRLRA